MYKFLAYEVYRMSKLAMHMMRGWVL